MCRPHYRAFMRHGNPLGKFHAVHGPHLDALKAVIAKRFPNRPELPVQLRIADKTLTISADDFDRFLSKVEVQPSGEWMWVGAVNPSGYGQFHLGGKYGPMAMAHRVAYATLIGPIPDGMDLDHVRHNDDFARGRCSGGPSCLHRREVDPDHLTPRTRRENWLLGAASSSIPQLTNTCKWGHPLTGDNLRLLVRKGGGVTRVCRACRARTARDAYARRATT